jgi:hypothetical protein
MFPWIFYRTKCEFTQTLSHEIMDIEKAKSMGLKLSQKLPTYDVPVDLIEPDPDNPNFMDDEAFNQLVKEMEENGCIVPIQLAPYPGKKFRLVGGEHRWRGAKVLGWETIPANIIMDLVDDDLRSFLVVRLNVLSGKIDPEKFARLYTEKAKRYGHDQLKVLFGYTDTGAWNKLTSGMVKAIASSDVGGRGRASSIAKELEKRTKGVKTADGLARVVSDLMQNHGVDRNSVAIFSHGGQKLFHIAMSKRLAGSFEELMRISEGQGRPAVDVLADAIEEYLKRGEA